MLDNLILLVFPAILAYAAVSDLMTMRISNMVSILLVSCFLVLALFVGMPLEQIGLHLAVALAVLAVTFAFFAFGWIGGGDAKMAAAAALWFGPALGFVYLLQVAFLGGVLTLIILLVRRTPLPVGLLGIDWIAKLHDRSNGVPYGVALAAAAMLVYPQTQIFLALAA